MATRKLGNVCLAAALTLAVTCGCQGGQTGGTPAGSSSGASPVTLKDGSKVKLALVPGGVHQYFQIWKTEMPTVQSTLGLADATFNEASGWDQTKQNALLDSLINQGYNAFGVFGTAPTTINKTFAHMKSKGVAVAALAGCPNSPTDLADFCLATDAKVAAYTGAQALIKAMGGTGNLVHITGDSMDANTQLRIAGVKKAVAETNGEVTLMQTVHDPDLDLPTSQKAVTRLLAAKGHQITGILATAYNPSIAAAEEVKEAGLPIKVVGIDDDQAIISGIQNGSVAATIVQNPQGQADIAGWALALLASGQCTMRKPGVIVDSGSFIVTQDNLTTIDTERLAKADQIKNSFAADFLNCVR
jgi:ribose transport system substrate-binding protein